MPTVITKLYTPAAIFQGPVDAFVNVPAPTSHMPPTQADELALDASGQPPTGGVHLGSLNAPGSVTITEKFNEIRDDQHESGIDAAFDTVAAEIDLDMKETNLQNILTLLTAVGSGTFTSLANSQVLQVGGTLTSGVAFFPLMLVGGQKNFPGKFVYVYAFKCYLKSSFPLTFHRSKENDWKAKFGCLADLTRVAGDEVMHVVKF